MTKVFYKMAPFLWTYLSPSALPLCTVTPPFKPKLYFKPSSLSRTAKERDSVVEDLRHLIRMNKIVNKSARFQNNNFKFTKEQIKL